MIALLLAVATAAGGVVDRIAAVVNDEVIALSEVYELGGDFVSQRCPEGADPCVTEAELEILDALIRRVLIRQELKRLDLEVTAADVDQAIDRTVRQYQLADRQALKAEVEASGKRWDQYREELFEFLRTQNFQGRVLAPRVTVRDDEVLDLYNRTARSTVRPVASVAGFGVAVPPGAPPEVVAAVEQQAAELVAALNAGTTGWEEAVSLYDGAGLAAMFGGKEFDQGALVEPIDRVVFAAEVGRVQAPLRMGDVLLILKVVSRGEKSEAAAFEEVEERLKDEVFRLKLEEAEEEWYQRARREAAIDVKLVVR